MIPIEVLNGTVRTGDRVAFAVRDGNSAAIRIGVVEGAETRKESYSERYITRLKIRVTHTSGSYPKPGTVVGIEKFDRVVKLFPPDEHFMYGTG